MAEFNGIDVSEFQGIIDWQRVKNDGIEFAIIRCGYGRFSSQKDSRFEENYINAKRAGIKVGAYLFSYAQNVENARLEAENCLGFIKNKQFEYPIVFDIETSAQARLGRNRVSEIAKTFCDTLEENGYYVSIYSYLNFLNDNLTNEVRTRYDIWLAQWAPRPTYNGNFGMWQYSPSGTVNGIYTSVDLDKAYKDYPSIIIGNSLNGFSDNNTPMPIEPEIFAGKRVTLSRTPVYSSSTSSIISVRLSGNYYIYSASEVNGRYRITNRESRVGRRPAALFVTGWVNRSDIV